MKKLLVIIDMVKGFVDEGNLADKNINKITPNIIKLIETFIASNNPIVTFRDTHKENDEEMKTYPLHCLAGTAECELIDELKPWSNNFIDIKKNTTNGFETDEFKSLINNNYFDEVHITGCCTDICVECFALSFANYIKEHNLNTKLIVYQNAVYTFDNPSHRAEKCHEESLKRMEENNITIKNS